MGTLDGAFVPRDAGSPRGLVFGKIGRGDGTRPTYWVGAPLVPWYRTRGGCVRGIPPFVGWRGRKGEATGSGLSFSFAR